jgi:hypothetical protein
VYRILITIIIKTFPRDFAEIAKWVKVIILRASRNFAGQERHDHWVQNQKGAEKKRKTSEKRIIIHLPW